MKDSSISRLLPASLTGTIIRVLIVILGHLEFSNSLWNHEYHFTMNDISIGRLNFARSFPDIFQFFLYNSFRNSGCTTSRHKIGYKIGCENPNNRIIKWGMDFWIYLNYYKPDNSNLRILFWWELVNNPWTLLWNLLPINAHIPVSFCHCAREVLLCPTAWRLVLFCFCSASGRRDYSSISFSFRFAYGFFPSPSGSAFHDSNPVIRSTSIRVEMGIAKCSERTWTQ